tara:strand:+ start:291 stop:500 length:210 start_codon:yes stop_codon:yes gene_type:complete
MKIGDLLTTREGYEVEGKKSPLLVVLDIKKHSRNAQRDRIVLQWMPSGDGEPLKGAFSRVIVEKKYKVL